MPQADPIDVQDHRSAEILSVAARYFQERGYEATSIDDVARGVGATKGKVYHHFRSKADLFAAVFRSGMAMLAEAVEPLLERECRAVDKLRLLAEAHTETILKTRAYQRVVWEGVEMHLRGATTPSQREALDALARSRNVYEEMFRPVMEAARRDGDLDYPNVSIALQLFLMTLNSPVIWYSPRPRETDADRRNIVHQTVDFAMAGLRERRERKVNSK